MENKILKIKTREGRIAKFNEERIADAILKALQSTSQGDEALSQKLTGDFVKVLNKRFKDKEVPNIEEIQDLIEEIFVLEGLTETVKSFILYRDQRRKIRETIISTESAVERVDSYLDKLDWEVQENANMSFSLQGLNHHGVSYIIKKYWLNKIYPKEIRDANENGDFHLHNLDSLAPYCSGWSLYDFLKKGFCGAIGKLESTPPKHFRTVLGQIVNFIYTMSGEVAGAVSFSNFDTLIAPFIRYDKLTYEQVKQSMQEFLFNMATPTRVGFQCPFSNITLDLVPSTSFAKQPVIIGGKPQNETYSEFQEEMNMLNKALFEVMVEGDKNQRVFTFPIPTINITKDFDWDNPALEPMWEATAKYGINYFANYINSDMSPADTRSMCVHGNTIVKIKRKDGTKILLPIKEVIGIEKNYKLQTSQGYKNVKREIITYADELLEIKTKAGKSLSVTKEHPSLIYEKNGELIEVRSENLKIGDKLSIRPDYVKEKNPNYGHKWTITQKEKASNTKIEYYKDTSKRLCKEKNGMYKRKQTEKTKKKISDKCKNHFVSEECKMKSSKRWLDINNPVFKKTYWSNSDNKNQVSKKEQIIKNFLDTHEIVYEYQYPFFFENKNLIVDFYIPSKRLVIESESKTKQTTFNEQNILSRERFDLLRKKDINVVVTNPEKNNAWMQYVNRVDEIVSINIIKNSDKNHRVYDFEIDETDGKYKAHDFYANDILTHNCCRLRLDLRELMNRGGGGLFGSGDLTGSIGVVTINMPRIGYLSKTKKEFYRRLDSIMELAKKSLELKRKTIETFAEKGLYPYSRYYLSSIKESRGEYYNNHFSTIGLVGMNEMLLNFLDEDISTQKGRNFALEVMDFMRDKLLKFQKETNSIYNLEATPSESCLVGSTLIKTIDGDKQIKDLVGKTPIVYTYDEKDNKIKLKKVSKVWKTSEMSPIYRVWFDDNSFIDCTGNHPFARHANGKGKKHITWVPAALLKKGYSLKSLGITADSEGYYVINSHTLRSRVVYEYFSNSILNKKDIIHHKDFDKTNDLYENLEKTTEFNHKRLHYMSCTSDYCKNRSGEKNSFYGKKHKEKSKDLMSKTKIGVPFVLKNITSKKFSEIMSISAKNKPFFKHSHFRKDIKDEDIIKLYNSKKNIYEIAKKLKCKESLIVGRFSRLKLNHKVVKVEMLKEMKPVYNMEVEDTNCFFAGSEILVHNTSYRLCLMDVEKYPDIITAGTKSRPYYTNSSLLPANFTDDVFEALQLQDTLQCKYTGGTVHHIFLGERLSDIESVKSLIKTVFGKFKLPYITLTPTFSICPVHGYISGEHFVCPKCRIEKPEKEFVKIEEAQQKK